MLSYLYNKLYGTSQENNYYNNDDYRSVKTSLDYAEYSDILECVPIDNNSILDLNKLSTLEMTNEELDYIDNLVNNNLIKSIANFCQKSGDKKFAISLSGGVDSMVLITIIKYLGYNVIALHINYNNRAESKKEETFIEEWCEYNNIMLYVKSIQDINRDNCKRSVYEASTKKIRFDFYREILDKENLKYVLLGHHKDDIVENIFANVCRSRFILDLTVIRDTTIINNVTICRPMIEHYKDIIYEFAHINLIPYFKDTTPQWSVRGKYRNIIAPALIDTFTDNIKENLIFLGKQSDEWNELINKEIILPFFRTIEYGEKSVKFNIEKWKNYPLCFWNQVFMKLFYLYDYNCPSRRSVQNFMNNLLLDTCLNISITNTTKCKLKNNWITIEFV